eukprot:TRINITY_DN10191_c0_g2_i1.p1 TRINITY_DN10191_c0_g2~~TRINITY_DN10191_c0_g2_i1.p1  ORF type:complete len:664 (+),score=151.40 TRINITY_DN10191_c0_g2_i1:37-2028(+)
MDQRKLVTVILVVCIVLALMQNTMPTRSRNDLSDRGFYNQQLIRQGTTQVNIRLVDTSPKVSTLETQKPAPKVSTVNCEDWSYAACPSKTCPSNPSTFCSWDYTKAACSCMSEAEKKEYEEQKKQLKAQRVEHRQEVITKAIAEERKRQKAADAMREAAKKNQPPTPPPVVVEEPVVPVVRHLQPASLTEPTPFGSLDPAKHHWFLGACTVTANSGQFLREWIELQHLAGVGHVWVINDNENGKDMETTIVLKEYEDKGFVTVVPGRALNKMDACKHKELEWLEAECISPKMCYQHVHQYVDWFVMIDTDEFMYPTIGCSLDDHVRNHCDPFQPFVLLRWERFGSSGWKNYPEGIIIENFLSSGGDCSDHHLLQCDKNPFDYCLECRHTKVMYNTKHCVDEEHVGWTHTPVNTTAWKNDPVSNGFIKSNGVTSNWKTPICNDHNRDFHIDAERCKRWLTEGGGKKVPIRPSKDCCAAGFGYNHYGIKNEKSWANKLKTWTRRGYKPLQNEGINLNTTVSSSVLRFLRHMRKGFMKAGEAVSENTKFIDFEDEDEQKTCFSEKGFKYTPNKESGTIKQSTEATSAAECCRECWKTATKSHKCGGWTFGTEEASCILLLASKTVVHDGVDTGRTRFPSSLLPALRTHAKGFTSGIPLYDGECSMP